MSSGFMLNINLGISMMRIFVLACSLFLSISVVADAAKIVLVAGSGKNPPPALATEVQLKGPFGVDWNSSGDLYIIEIAGHRVMKVDSKNNLTLVGGTGAKGSSGDNANAQEATFNGMHSVIIGKDDSIYVAIPGITGCVRLIPKRTSSLHLQAQAPKHS